MKRLLCALFHRWVYWRRGEWRPVGFADWRRVVWCDRCPDSWAEYR